jgi:hypothetical protein
MADDGFEVVFTASSMLEAELIKGLLEGEGIAARIPGELATDPWTTTEETLGDVPIEVPEGKVSEARGIIAEAKKEGAQEQELERWLEEHGDEIPESEREHEVDGPSPDAAESASGGGPDGDGET